MTINGKYEMVSSDKFDEYLKAVGVGLVTRKLANQSKPTIEVTEGETTLFKTITSFKTIELKFKCGEEFTEETADGRKCQTTIVREGNKFVQTQSLDGVQATVTREFTADGMTTTFSAGGVTAVRVYKKV